MKKSLLSLLCIAMLASGLLASCGQNQEEKRNESSDTSGGGMHSSGTGQ